MFYTEFLLLKCFQRRQYQNNLVSRFIVFSVKMFLKAFVENVPGRVLYH